MPKRKNHKMNFVERAMHDQAVAMRKLTDVQLMKRLSDERNRGRYDGLKEAEEGMQQYIRDRVNEALDAVMAILSKRKGFGPAAQKALAQAIAEWKGEGDGE